MYLPSAAHTFRPAGPAQLCRPIVAFLALAASFGVHGATLPNMPDRTYVTDGDVNAIARVGDTIYIGGSFQRVGPRTGPGAEVALNGTWIDALPQVSGAGPGPFGLATGVRAVVSDGAGGWYVGGAFTHVGGIARANIAHILGDHSVDPAFNAIVDGSVEALALSGPTLYIGGAFSLVDGQLRGNVAALATADGSVTGFNPNADAEIEALAVSTDGNAVYAGGGGFTSIGGSPRTSLAALDPVTGQAIASFNPVLAMANGAPTVQSLAVSGVTLYAGGNFDSVNGTTRRTLAALDASGGVIVDFAPAPTYFGCIPCATVVAIAVSASAVYVGGSFDTIGGAARNNIAALAASTGVATAFNPDAQGNLISLATSGNTVYAGGGFYTIGGQPRHFAAALDGESGSALAFDPDPNGSISAIAATDSAVYMGGLFSSLGGVQRGGLAAIDAATGTATAWDPAAVGMNGNLALINAIVATDSTLYVAGTFATLGGQSRQNIGAVNLSDAVATDWNPTSDGDISTLALSGSVMYAGGSFINIGGQQRIFIAALDVATGAATGWDPSADNTVQSIAVAGDVVYAGGMFFDIGGQQRLALAALRASDGTATDWNPDPGPAAFGAYVYDVKVDGTMLYVAGGFGSMQGVPRHNVAALSLTDATPGAFDPETSGGGNDGAVSTLAIDGSSVYLGGDFTLVGDQPRVLVAAVNKSNGGALAFNPNGSGGTAVHVVSVAPDGTLYVGGSFPTFDLAYQQGFAAFSPAAPNDLIFADGFD